MTKHLTMAAGLCLALALGTVACDETIRLPNRAPSVVFESVDGDGGVLDVYYWVIDLDGDDVDIDLEVCGGGDCSIPLAAPGGDGLNNLPTNGDQPVLHLFRWAVGCDVGAEGLDESFVFGIVPTDGRNEGPPAESDELIPEDLGVDETCDEP